MSTSRILAMMILALLAGAIACAHAQSPAASYTFQGEYLRQIYNNGIQALDAGNYLVAHRHLSTYWSLAFGFGVFNQNPQFSGQLNKALDEIEAYFQNAVAQRQALGSQLEECQRRASGSIRSRGLALSAPPMLQLPRVPPER